MNDSSPWKEFWERKAHPDTPDHVFDRGSPARAPEVEELSRLELLDFIDPRESEYVLDAGCGTGGNVLLLSSKVSRLIALDFASAALARARQRLTASSISNALLVCGTVSALPLPDRSVDKIICLSVLQYMDDAEVRRTFSEFARVVRVGGVLILHVKNLASLYLFSLLVAKRFKQLLGRRTVIEHFRTYRWYVAELKAAGFDVTDYASSNLFMLESLPRRLVTSLQTLELRHHRNPFFRAAIVRRLGSDLKLKATKSIGLDPNTLRDRTRHPELSR